MNRLFLQIVFKMIPSASKGRTSCVMLKFKKLKWIRQTLHLRWLEPKSKKCRTAHSLRQHMFSNKIWQSTNTKTVSGIIWNPVKTHQGFPCTQLITNWAYSSAKVCGTWINSNTKTRSYTRHVKYVILFYWFSHLSKYFSLTNQFFEFV